MTKLVERCCIEITLDHEAVESSVYGGSIDLKDRVRDVLPRLPAWFDQPKGKIELEGGGLVVRWEYTGLMEEPEATGGDN